VRQAPAVEISRYWVPADHHDTPARRLSEYGEPGGEVELIFTVRLWPRTAGNAIDPPDGGPEVEDVRAGATELPDDLAEWLIDHYYETVTLEAEDHYPWPREHDDDD
jgi:hypothetical protein